jgi:uncharacterized protein (DUF2236 family)
VTAARPVLQRVHGERILLVGGQRSLILQLAHPMVAAAVDEHSDFPRGALRRLARTIELTMAVIHGPARERNRAASRIRKTHDRVSGMEREAGTHYRAEEPELLLWVLATLVDTVITVHRHFLRPLRDEEEAEYYEAMKEPGRAFGIPDEVMPPTVDAFHRYVDGMLGGGELRATAAGRGLVAQVLRPSTVPLWLRPGTELGRLLTVALLPDRIRELFDLDVSPASGAALAAVSKVSRIVLPFVPWRLRSLPQAR